MTQHEELIERVMNVPCHTEDDAKALAAIADALEDQSREIAALKERVEGLRKDAELLDFLEETLWRPNPPHHYGNLGGNFDLQTVDGVQSESLRLAISAAIVAKGGRDA